MTVLGLDPGTRKCGFAIVTALDTPPARLGIVPLADLRGALREILIATPADIAAVGRGTNADEVSRIVREAGLPVTLVDEYETTLRARERYFKDHPPQGFRRFIPRGMLLPDRPIDDYAALLIAERFLRGSA